MSRDFTNDIDAGRQLAQVIDGHFDVVVAVLPTSRNIANEVAQALNVPQAGVIRVMTGIEEEPVRIELALGDVAKSARLLIVDDAVETGRTSVEISRALKSAGYGNLTLAVPVCPRDSEYLVKDHFDGIIAVVRPLMRRALSWHYDEVPGSD